MSADKENAEDDRSPDRKVEQATSPIEWSAAAIGALLLVVMIGYMAWIGIEEVDGAPLIELSSTAPVRQGNAFLVRFNAINKGDATAAGLVVKAVLRRGEQEIESSEVTIDYLPSDSERSGGFFFENDPKGLDLSISVTGYVDP